MEKSIERLFHWAAYADKYGGNSNLFHWAAYADEYGGNSTSSTGQHTLINMEVILTILTELSF